MESISFPLSVSGCSSVLNSSDLNKIAAARTSSGVGWYFRVKNAEFFLGGNTVFLVWSLKSLTAQRSKQISRPHRQADLLYATSESRSCPLAREDAVPSSS